MIKKAIVLAAGKGTRLLPLTLAIPKEMIRVGVKPVIEHVVEVLKAGGIKEILIIVGRNKEAIMNYLGSGERLGVEIYYRIQEEPKGSAHATYHGKDFIGSEDFVLIYGDNYIKPYEIMKDIIEKHKKNGANATIVLQKIKNPKRYGLAKIDSRGNVKDVIEKPTFTEAKSFKIGDSYFAIAGLLVLNSSVFKYIEKTKLGKNNEIWLTDSVKSMIKEEGRIQGFVFHGTRYDIGTFQSLKEADKDEQKEKISG
ncbi:nucleotidyltransferase family protein [Thermoproteota archaeon]